MRLLLLSAALLGSCAAPTRQTAPIFDRADALHEFVARLDTEPGAVVVTHRLEINGTAPLELVVEERCVPRKCTFGDTHPALTRFRIYDVTDPRAPVAMHKTPIVAAHLATLAVAEFDGALPHELVVREAAVGFEEVAETAFSYRGLTLGQGEWTAFDLGPCSHDIWKNEATLALFADVDDDGVSQWIAMSKNSPLKVCEPANFQGYRTLENVDIAAVQAALNKVLAGSPSPDEVLALVSVLAAGGVAPTGSEAYTVLMAEYERTAQHGLPLWSISADGLGSLRIREKTACADARCLAAQTRELAVQWPAAQAMRQQLILDALSGPDRPTVADWATSRIRVAKTAEETTALTRLAWGAADGEHRSDWAERLAAEHLQVLAEMGLPADVDPDGRVEIQASHRAIVGLDALLQTRSGESRGWDTKVAFRDFYEGLRKDDGRLESALEHPALALGLLPFMVEDGWLPTTSDAADVFIASFAQMTPPSLSSERDAIRTLLLRALANSSITGGRVLLNVCGDELTDPTAIPCSAVFARVRVALATMDASYFLATMSMDPLMLAWLSLPDDDRTWWVATLKDAGREHELAEKLARVETYRGKPHAVDVALANIGYFNQVSLQSKLVRGAGKLIASEGATEQQVDALNAFVEKILLAETSTEITLEGLRTLEGLPRLSPSVRETLVTMRQSAVPEVRTLIEGLLRRPQ
ncbi:MAG: hypothetical protein R3E66_18340 [bacterium]